MITSPERMKPQRVVPAFSEGAYIKRIDEEVGGGGDLIQTIVLADDKAIVLGYGQICVYHTADEYWGNDDPEVLAHLEMWADERDPKDPIALFKNRLSAFWHAAYELNRVWETNIDGSQDYPFVESFDELLLRIARWNQTQFGLEPSAMLQ